MQRSWKDTGDGLKGPEPQGSHSTGSLAPTVNGCHLSSFHCTRAKDIKHSPFPPSPSVRSVSPHTSFAVTACLRLHMYPLRHISSKFPSFFLPASFSCHLYSSPYSALFSCPVEKMARHCIFTFGWTPPVSFCISLSTFL